MLNEQPGRPLDGRRRSRFPAGAPVVLPGLPQLAGRVEDGVCFASEIRRCRVPACLDMGNVGTVKAHGGAKGVLAQLAKLPPPAERAPECAACLRDPGGLLAVAHGIPTLAVTGE